MKNSGVRFEDLGILEYQSAFEYQEALFQQSLSAKSLHQSTENHLLFCEHPPVFTLGKSGKLSNLLIDELQLKQRNIQFYQSNRGGDITFHGYGQIVGYPIFDLDNFNLGLKAYIELLEESIIRFLAKYGLSGHRLEGATGVWLDGKRKICAIGVKASRMITMHGFALNISTDLQYFDLINPCGITDKGVTTLEKELGYPIDFEACKSELLACLREGFEQSSVDAEQ
jgi:lipoyl(octanoyl) transferase